MDTMDEFAQSREDDDLFADEFEPVSQPAEVEPPLEVPASIPQPIHTIAKNTSTNPPPTGPAKNGNTNRGGGHERRERGRGRGGRGGQGGSNGLNQSRFAPQQEPPPAPAASSPPTETTTETPQAPPSDPTPARITAVRGDRRATGGNIPKKLTEEELTLKLEQMAILNKAKSEKHRLEEADQAAFQHREKELAKERKEKQVAEKKNSRQMEMERAKNRQRKMQAQGGREWDSEKVESDIVDGKGRGRSSEYVRGGYGGVIRGRGAGLAASRDADEDVPEETPSRGRGGFEIRGRGRGARGGRGGAQGGQPVMGPEDFPSLPTASKVVEAVDSPAGDKPAGDWAEEMATPVEAKAPSV